MKGIHGLGLGLRPAHLEEILGGSKQVTWFEVLADNFMQDDGRHLQLLEKIRRDYPIVLHCVGMNIGSIDPLNEVYLTKLQRLIDRFEPSGISDHLAWIGCDNTFHHDLLPIPLTVEALQQVSGRIAFIQEKLQRTIWIENISSYLDFSFSTMREWEFLNELTQSSGCQLLLDINNIYVNAVNHGFDPNTYIEAIRARDVAQLHIAGHSPFEGGLIDSHSTSVASDVRKLLLHTQHHLGAKPLCLEWDQNLPSYQSLVNEVKSLDFQSTPSKGNIHAPS